MPQVKTALTTVLFALAIYQVAMMSVGDGKVRVPFLKPKGHVIRRLPVRRPMMAKATPSYAKQVLWSLLAAAVITVATIALVTAKIGLGLDSRELRERQELSRSVGRPARSGWRSRRTRS